MKVLDMLVLIVLAAIWGASLIFMRVSTPHLGPIATIWMRVFVASLVMMIWFAVRKKEVKLKGSWDKMIFLGAINAAIPFALTAASNMILPISTIAVITATTPLFTVMMAWIFLKEPLRRNHFLAFICGIGGVSALLGLSPMQLTTEVLMAALMALGASFCYGIGGVYVKKELMEYDNELLIYGQQLGAVIVLLPIFFIQAPVTWHVPFNVWLSVVALGVFCTEIAYIIYFSMIRRIGPTKTLSVTFLVPIFGMLWGVIFMHESLSVGFFLGFALILVSLFLLSERPLLWGNNKRHTVQAPDLL